MPDTHQPCNPAIPLLGTRSTEMHTYEHQKLETKSECPSTKWVDYWVFIKWNTHNENELLLHATTWGGNVEQKKPVDIE